VTAYELREGSDGSAVVLARGRSPGATLAAAGNAAAVARWPSLSDPGVERYDCAATAGDPTGLLFDYLDELDYQRDVRDVVPVDSEATVERRGHRLRLSGTFRSVDPEEPPRELRVAGPETPITRSEDG
jgi:hypothetical protein